MYILTVLDVICCFISGAYNQLGLPELRNWSECWVGSQLPDSFSVAPATSLDFSMICSGCLQLKMPPVLVFKIIKNLLILAGLFFCDFLLRDFAVTWPEDIHRFLNLGDNVCCNTFLHRRYTIIFGLTRCGVHGPWLLLSCVWSQQKPTSLSRHHWRVWIVYVSGIMMWLI
jgi:hypothetical protein